MVQRVRGDTFEGVLVTDCYAAYGRWDSLKQKCLAHLLRERHTLRQEPPQADVDAFIQPVMTRFQAAIALGKQRDELSPEMFARERQELEDRLDRLMFPQPTHPDCRRICNRLAKHRFERPLFLEVANLPPDNNLGERDIRSVAAARAEGGVNRTDRGAKAFAIIKSIIRTCQKQGVNFFESARAAMRTALTGRPPPLPLAAANR